MAYIMLIVQGGSMMIEARYVHTNLVAQDWRALAGFYQRTLGCVPVLPERDFQGPALEAATGMPGAHLRGMHLRLPGYGEGGPTLEVFQYSPEQAPLLPAPNRPGYGHLAFSVTDVPAAQAEILAAGGKALGEIVTLQTADGARVTFVYVTDPEGNILELQAWQTRGLAVGFGRVADAD
jgi:catechol 2,3-dioxygenase-like lactoylglutathione lyase family enzyme